MYFRIYKYEEKMSGVNNPKSSLGNAVKIYLFPALVTILATLIWRDVTEMRSDIKMLLAQSNIDKTDIQNLKRDVQTLEFTVFNKKITASIANNETKSLVFREYRDKYFKPEEIFDITKYIPKS
jgi:hypothetical protein